MIRATSRRGAIATRSSYSGIEPDYQPPYGKLFRSLICRPTLVILGKEGAIIDHRVYSAFDGDVGSFMVYGAIKEEFDTSGAEGD